MANRVLKVIKKARSSPLPDVPIHFPKLENLHLEYLEVKDKLKSGLPLIPKTNPNLLAKPKVNIPVKDDTSEKKKPAFIVIESRSKGSTKEESKKKEDHKKDDQNSKKKKSSAKKEEEEDDIIKDLGESGDESLEDKKTSKSKIVEPPKSTDKSKPIKKSKSDSSKSSLDSDSESESDDANSSDSSSEEKEQETVPDETDIYAGLSPEERAAKEKEEYLWRFRILKKKYGNGASIPIPEWNEHSDLPTMKLSYERTIKELYLDDSVETYRTYLMGGWVIMEYVCVTHIGIDLRGFTSQQIRMMNKYDRMLIELGEKSYTRWGMNLPVEIRLIGMILFQAGIFYLGKIIAENYGSNVADLFKGFTGQPPDKNQAAGNEKTPPIDADRRMKGPRMTADDIRNRQR